MQGSYRQPQFTGSRPQSSESRPRPRSSSRSRSPGPAGTVPSPSRSRSRSSSPPPLQLAASPAPPLTDSDEDPEDWFLRSLMKERVSQGELAKNFFKFFAGKLGDEIQVGGGYFMESINIMLPKSTATPQVEGKPHLLTDIYAYCNGTPNLDEPMATQDDLGEPNKDLRRRKKAAISDLFDPSSENGTNLSDMNKFYDANNVSMESLIRAEKDYSEILAQQLLTDADCLAEAEVMEGPLQNLPEFRDLELGGGKIIPGVHVDVVGVEYIAGFTQYLATSSAKEISNFVKRAVNLGTKVTIRIGLTVIQISVYGLIFLSKHLYNWGIGILGSVGEKLDYMLGKLWEYKKLLFGGPFMDITNPSPESSYNRRMNRFVYLFLYTMIDLLKFIKENKKKLSPILREEVGMSIDEPLSKFLERPINSWTYDEIFDHGPQLFVHIMNYRSVLEPIMLDFYDRYDKSIKVVTESLDARITQHLVNNKMVPELETFKTVIGRTPPIRIANEKQMEAMEVAIVSYINTGLDPVLGATIRDKGYGGMMEAMMDAMREGGGVSAGAQEPEPQDYAQSKKKKTRRRRKSKSRNSTKGKKKKGKKRKQTKRGRKKK